MAPSTKAPANHSVGSCWQCTRPGDGQHCEARILESRRAAAGGHEYYVHYRGLNRRLDEWVAHDRLRPIERARARGRPRGLHELAGLRASYNTMVPPSARARAQPEGDGELDERTLKEHEAATKVKNIASVVLGCWQMDAWYFSPFPNVPEGGWCAELYLCEHCLAHHAQPQRLSSHRVRCGARHPPGDEIYRDGCLSVFEVQSATSPAYARRLCLLGKLFLDHKVLLRPPPSYAFYTLVKWQQGGGCELLGYFSKDLAAPNTLACLLVLPPHQRKGYGALLVGLSYELARRAGTPGAPERPLSDLGLATYRGFWASALLQLLAERARAREPVSVRELCALSGICEEDVLGSLRALKLLRYAGGAHSIRLSTQLLAQHAPGAPAHGSELAQRGGSVGHARSFPLVVDPSKLRWTPRAPPPAAGLAGPSAPTAAQVPAAAAADAAGGEAPAAAAHSHKRARTVTPPRAAAAAAGGEGGAVPSISAQRRLRSAAS